MPFADFCDAVKVNRFTFSHEFVTCRRSPEVSSTAFDAQPPDLPLVGLMDMCFARRAPPGKMASRATLRRRISPRV